VVISYDEGESWKQLLDESYNVYKIKVINSDIYCFSLNNEIYKSIDNGLTWVLLASDTPEVVNDMIMLDSDMYMICTKSGIHLSKINSAANWELKSNGITNVFIHSMAINSNNDLYLSSSAGAYKLNSSGTLSLLQEEYFYIDKMVCTSTDRIIGIHSGVLVIYDELLKSWRTLLNGYQAIDLFCSSRDIIYFSNMASVLSYNIETNEIETKYTAENNGHIYNFYLNENSGNLYIINEESKLLLSVDDGENWNTIPLGGDFSPHLIDQIITTSKSLFISVRGEGLYKSNDLGLSWEVVNDAHKNVLSIYSKGSIEEVILDSDEKMYISRDNGINWQLLAEDFSGLTLSNQEMILIGTNGRGLYKCIRRK